MEGNFRWAVFTAVAPVAWGSTYYVTHEFLPADAPLYAAAIRALPAGALLLLFCRAIPRGSWWWKSAVLGVLNMSAFFALVYMAAQLMPASIASVIMATSSVVMMLIAWLMLAERPRLLAAGGAGLGVLGVSAMLLTGDEAASGWGVLASVTAMVMSSFGYILAKKWGGDVPVLASTSWQLIAGGVVILPFAVVVEGAPPALNLEVLTGFGYLSLVATALAFTAWFGGLRRLDAGRVGLIGLLNPVTGVVLGLALGGEALNGQQIIGLGLTLTGILLGQSILNHRRARTEPGPRRL